MSCRLATVYRLVWVVWAATLSAGIAAAQQLPQTPPLVAKTSLPVLSQEEAVRRALDNNPELAAFRQQRGIAAAGVVLANTYPFNPVLESRVEYANGPEEGTVTNHVLNEHKLLLELEIRGQRGYRQQAAAAALTRTDWEVANQEVQLATRTLRAFDGVLYRLDKLKLSDERIRLNENAAEQIRKLRELGKVGAADVLLIQTEVDDARAQRGGAELALVTADYELRRSTGVIHEVFDPAGSLVGRVPAFDVAELTAVALERRPDLRAKQAAVAEAEARTRLEVANRFGNPTLGPSYQYDPTKVTSIGITVVVPVPVLNTKRGDIQQRQAEQARAVLELRQTSVAVQQDVLAALARLERAQAVVETYEKQVLPNLRKNLASMEKLFAAADPGVDVVRVLEVRRTLLKASDSYLDALWERAQARADVVAAAGDLGLVLGPNAWRCPPK
jgi:cobalt-zinc-cadmium efflux system outer membrane protein